MKFKFGRKYIKRPLYYITNPASAEFQAYKTEFIKQMDKMFENQNWNIPIR